MIHDVFSGIGKDQFSARENIIVGHFMVQPFVFLQIIIILAHAIYFMVLLDGINSEIKYECEVEI